MIGLTGLCCPFGAYENYRDLSLLIGCVVHSDLIRIIVITLPSVVHLGYMRIIYDKSYRHLKSMHSDHMRINVISLTLNSSFGSFENYGNKPYPL